MLSGREAFFRRRKETTSTQEEGVLYEDIPKQRGVVVIVVMH
jgi:hypothetical protein